MVLISGFPTIKSVDLIWNVMATDGLYEQLSNAPNAQNNPPGFRLQLERVGDLVAELPAAGHFSLDQNYPNPVRSATTIPVSLRNAGDVRLRVFNLLGEEVARLHDGFLSAGVHRFRFSGVDLAPGVYRYRLEAGERTRTRAMVVLR